MHVHTDHESLRYLKTCPRPLTPRQARWSKFREEYNLTLWYVPGLENPAADACSRLTSQQFPHANLVPSFILRNLSF